MQAPRIVDLPEKLLVGMRLRTNLLENSTPTLWSRFMPRCKEIPNRVGQELYSVHVYPLGYFQESFQPEAVFEKWAAVEATAPPEADGLETLVLPAGRYAVFVHKGPASDFQKTAHYIFSAWLPGSGFRLDHRPHFEVMGNKYLGHTHPDSEEEVWVPIQ